MIKTGLTILLLCATLFARLEPASAQSMCDTATAQMAELLDSAQTALSNGDIGVAKTAISAAQLLVSLCGESSAATTPATPAPNSLMGRILFVSEGGSIAVMNADGSGVQDLRTAAAYLGWSPDGTQIVYSQGGTIVIMNADGSNPVPLVLDASGGGVGPSWSPDGRLIAFHGPTSGGPYLYRIADGAITQVSSDTQTTQSAWSPDSTRLAYPFYANGQFYIKVIHLDDNTDDEYLMPGRPNTIDWAPDGQHIAFDLSDTVRGDDGLYLMNADGSDIHLLRKGAYEPAWSPDGSQILFGQNRGLYVMNADGIGETLIAQGASNASWIAGS